VTLEIVSDRILTPEGVLRAGRVLVEDGRIAAVDVDGSAKPPGGRMLLPGMVDLHGDAFEHQLMPRPGVGIPVEIALADTDRQLAANGITTPFLSLTCSWESGLRSADTVNRMLDALDRMRELFSVDYRIHLRFETMALDTVATAAGWIESGRIDLVSINDHFPGLNAKRDTGEIDQLAKRSGIDRDSYVALLDALAARRDEMGAATAAIIAGAAGAGVPVASHDDRTAEERRANRALGCTLADFPITEAAIREANATGDTVILGAPNVLRGGSHMAWKGAIAAAGMVEAGLCTVLASDYFYPALAPAAMRLWRDHGVADAWALVSSSPARAVGLSDRGALAAGMRADLVLVDAGEAGLAVRTLATIAGGHAIVHHRDGAAAVSERPSVSARRVVAGAA